MSKISHHKVFPCLWYTKDAVGAARFYASLFPDSRVDRIRSLPADSPSGPAGSVDIVEFTVCGVSFMAFTAGKHHDFNDSVSFVVNCASQAEIDRYWDAIVQAGGKPQACGWIIDHYGVRWQIVPEVLADMMTSDDNAGAQRAAAEMLNQVKLDIAKLQAAFEGR